MQFVPGNAITSRGLKVVVGNLQEYYNGIYITIHFFTYDRFILLFDHDDGLYKIREQIVVYIRYCISEKKTIHQCNVKKSYLSLLQRQCPRVIFRREMMNLKVHDMLMTISTFTNSRQQVKKLNLT